MITRETDEKLQFANDFIEKLEDLKNDKRGNARRELSSLKRNAGNEICEVRRISDIAWFYRLLAKNDYVKPDIPFLVATLWALNPRKGTGNMGKACNELWERKKLPKDTDKDKARSAVARRFNILLDADLNDGELAFRLRQFVKLLASYEVGLDWAQLLLDLQAWHYPGKRKQREWAKSFYAPDYHDDALENSNKDKEGEDKNAN